MLPQLSQSLRKTASMWVEALESPETFGRNAGIDAPVMRR
jgi:hypothetical protein